MCVVTDLATSGLRRLRHITSAVSTEGGADDAGSEAEAEAKRPERRIGRFEDTPSETFQRVVDTTLLGAVHGARAALPVFRAQGEGVLVNVASIYGHLSTLT